ncbi:hypothetical protein F3Y22_tig00111769pilonHSYRG00061 [Hibiscus syriacus]|uniref:Wall-associated receptor kinase galacturonan-binding domain-containing protein n=1 Tax=Hibiscus syriacus TaxID=106335 RepID=A0A6A2XDY5_HIBSY|nr:hypothetical protein F3Y22_tig00111769pilonHSYRG00061 [Hibiscus syriacus]
MGFHLGFYSILLFLLSPTLMAAESQESICGKEVCGNVTIPSPFGIHGSCYSRSLFRVICRQTQNGKRPFISINDFDVELLGSLFSGNTVLIKNPVTHVNCDDDRQKVDGINVGVNLTGTPFFFSSDYNLFGSVGCGNLAAVLGNDSEPLGGCIQPRCGGGGGAEAGCFNQVFGNFSSSMVEMTAVYDGGKEDERKRCSSAFLFSRLYFHGDDPLDIGNGVDIETTHVPTTLSWDSTYCGHAGCEPGLGPTYFISENSCGNITFQYPFEISDQLHHPNGSWFTVICNKTADGRSMPFLNINSFNLQILEFSFFLGNVVVNHSITYFNCRNNDNNNGMSLDLTATPFYYSDFDNIIWSPGCGNLVTVFDPETSNLIGGCLQPSCRNGNEASSATGCPTNVPHGLGSFFVNVSERVDASGYSQERSCGFASIVRSRLYYDLTIEPQELDMSNWMYVPISLQWSTPMSGLCHLRPGVSTTCSSDRQTCWQNLGSTHLCVCNRDFGREFSSLCKGKT